MVTIPSSDDRTQDIAKTVYFGRFSVSIPADSIVIFGRVDVPYPIVRYPKEASRFEKLVLERLNAIEDEKQYAEGELRGKESMLGKVVDGENFGQKIVFGVGQSSGDFYRIQSFLRISEDVFIQEANVYGGGGRYHEVVSKLKAIAEMIRPLSNSDCPPENGLCLDHAFMGEPRIAIREAFGIGIRLKKFPDVHFSISTTKKDRWVESDALEPRLLQAERDAIRAGHGDWYARIRTLRRGKRSLGNWKGFEVLAFKPRQAGEGTAHEFVFVSQGEPNNPLLPVLEIEMHTGVGQNRTGTVLPSLSDAEAVLLWDAVTKSIRVREIKTPRITE